MDDAARHAAFLDRYYGVQRHFYDVTRRLYLFGRQRMLRRILGDDGCTVLEIGCGTARNLLWLARCRPGARYVGVDASLQMLASAREKTAGHDNIQLFEACAEALPDPAALGAPGGFDVVFFSYSLSMMPDWHGALVAARECLAPGGSLYIADFWDFAGWPRWLAWALNRRLHAHRVHFEPGVHEWLRDAGGSLAIEPVAGRWAYLARLQN